MLCSTSLAGWLPLHSYANTGSSNNAELQSPGAGAASSCLKLVAGALINSWGTDKQLGH